ncbi:hypothetical protein A2W24_04075 [Microgenomates group bacterium RBG_16_45_19]|nr:MAG: hypothetical protein A2W24_04075 [Microgenomates group bacterium RBG_16_45_19]
MKSKLLITFLLIIIMLAGAAAGVFLVQRRQTLEQEAAVPSGTENIRLVPSVDSADPPATFDVNIVFTTSVSVSGVTALLTYPATAGITVTDVLPNQSLVNDYQWRYQSYGSSTTDDGRIQIQVIATNTSIEGYLSSTDTTLATIRFAANSQASIALEFDSNLTTISSKATGEDILSLPASPAGTYTSSGVAATPTPSPVNTPTPGPSATPAPGPTATPAPGPTATPAPGPTATPTPTALPSAGNPLPLLSLITLGFLVLTSGLIFSRRLS